MNSYVQEIKLKIRPKLKQAGVKHSAVFGSIAKGRGTGESDIDILVEFYGEKSLLDLIKLKDELETVLGRKVDLLTYNSLSPLLRESILRSQVSVYDG